MVPWALAFAGVLTAALVAPSNLVWAFSAGTVLAAVGLLLELSSRNRRHRILRHFLAGGEVPECGSGDAQLDLLMARPPQSKAQSSDEAVLGLLSEWAEGRWVEPGANTGQFQAELSRVRGILSEERDRVRSAGARLAEAAERGQRTFEGPAREVERCAESLRLASEAVTDNARSLMEGVGDLTAHARRWREEDVRATQEREAVLWTRRQLARALDHSAWSALDRDAEQIASSLQRLIGNLERDPDNAERMVWLGQARGQAEALERHRAAVHRAVDGARRALVEWVPTHEPDRQALDRVLARTLDGLRTLAESWRQSTLRSEAAAAAAVAGMPDAEWWVDELARLQWDLELALAQGSAGPEFQSQLEAILRRQREGRTPAAAALARGLERLEARLSEHSDGLEEAVQRLERLSGPS
ncbi:MAG: hypothetical protein AAGD10_19160 [Myxococcota bacterium]